MAHRCTVERSSGGIRMRSIVKSMKKILLTLILILLATPLWAVNYCVTPTGAGSYSGTDWNNTMKWNSGANQLTFARGDGTNKYYLADGTYEGITFDTAADETKVIEVRKAISSDHVTETGWVSTMGDGEALVSAGGDVISIDSSYWILNGQTRTTWTSGYGIRLLNTNTGLGEDKSIRLFGNIGNIIIKYVDMQNSGKDLGNDAGKDAFYSVGITSNVTVQYCYMHAVNRNIVTILNGSTFVFEYNAFSDNSSSPTTHGQVFQGGNNSGMTFRYNKAFNAVGQGFVAVMDGGIDSNYYIYGNVVYDCSDMYFVTVINTGTTMTNMYIYNNTLSNVTGRLGIACYSGAVCTNLLVKNNLFYNCGQVDAFLVQGTLDYNWQYNSDGSGSFAANDTHLQTGTGNPFSNLTGKDFYLSANTTAGANLGSSYNTDMDGVTRSTWSRGAYEYVGEPDTIPPVVTSGPTPSGTLVCDADPDTKTITVSTNESATTKYCKSGVGGCNASTTYDSMAGTFSSPVGTSHYQAVSGLACDASHDFYLHFMDLAGNKTTTSTPVSFSIQPAAGDVTPPVMSNAGPTTGSFLVCTTNPRPTLLQVTATDETPTVIAKYHTSDVAYDSMAGTFGTKVGDNFSQSANLSCGQSHTYCYRAADGVTPTPNKSPTSLCTTFTILSAVPPGIIEAESGTIVAPMVSVPDAAASGGYYIHEPDYGATGTVTFTVAVAVTGTYRIRARVYAIDGGTDSLYLNIDGVGGPTSEYTWDLNPLEDPNYYNVWFVDYVTKRGTGTFDHPQYDPYQIYLEAGNHTFVFTGREANARLDYLALESVDIPPQPPMPQGLMIVGVGGPFIVGSGGGGGIGTMLIE